MKLYHKIENLYERDVDGSRKLIEGKFRNEAVELLKDICWEWTEKIDGTNIRVIWDGHAVSFGGRTEYAQIPAPLANRLQDLFGGETNAQLFEQTFGEKEVILFGEGYGKKIQKVGADYKSDGVDLILFDVMIGDVYLRRENVEEIAHIFGIQAVPVVLNGTVDEAVAFVKQGQKSTIGTAVMEGVVGRPAVEIRDRMGNRLIVKIKARDFE